MSIDLLLGIVGAWVLFAAGCAVVARPGRCRHRPPGHELVPLDPVDAEFTGGVVRHVVEHVHRHVTAPVTIDATPVSRPELPVTAPVMTVTPLPRPVEGREVAG